MLKVELTRADENRGWMISLRILNPKLVMVKILA